MAALINSLQMSKKLLIASQIKNLKVGQSFVVTGETERQSANRAAKTLRQAGVISFDFVTKDQGDGTFKCAAI